jgi:RNA polymerase sigma-70 factor (ECF subfamily)
MSTYNTVTADDFQFTALPHLNDLFRASLRVTGREAEAEDLVQEVYMQAWASFRKFDPGTNCRAWLFKIFFHKTQHYRRQFQRVKFIEDSECFLELLPYEPPIPEHLSNEEVLSSLASISPCYREVVLLADVHGFSYQEISEMMDIPVGTVMSRLSRGRNLLRGKLKKVARSYGLKSVKAEG